jgi:hypothetical protein
MHETVDFDVLVGGHHFVNPEDQHLTDGKFL